MSSVVIIQRVVPHYRHALFQRLHDRFGWTVACARRPPKGNFFDLVEDAPYMRPFDFAFPDPRRPHIARVPVRRILRETGAQAVIAEGSIWMSSTWSLAFARRLMGNPVTLFWSHGFSMERGLATPWQRLQQQARLLYVRRADGHVCYSAEGKAYLDRHMDPATVFIARNTQDLAPMQARAERLGRAPAPGRPSLLTIGRFSADKDFARLVRIFKTLRGEFPDAHLTLIGDGPDADRVRAEAGELLGGAIDMPGLIYDEDELAARFMAADLVVFPGAVGLSVNHALAYGVPVVAYDRTARGPFHHPEIAYVVNGITGQRVAEYSEAAMHRALADFLRRHPDPRREFGPTIDRYVRENIALDVMVEDFARVRDFLRARGIAGA
ncbi:MAG: glycosyltransferase family 4 protein [Alphaproteobacteria bacterium]